MPKHVEGLALCIMELTMAAVAQTPVTTTIGGTTNTVPIFTGTSNIENSAITQSNGNVTVGTTVLDQNKGISSNAMDGTLYTTSFSPSSDVGARVCAAYAACSAATPYSSACKISTRGELYNAAWNSVCTVNGGAAHPLILDVGYQKFQTSAFPALNVVDTRATIRGVSESDSSWYATASSGGSPILSFTTTSASPPSGNVSFGLDLQDFTVDGGTGQNAAGIVVNNYEHVNLQRVSVSRKSGTGFYLQHVYHGTLNIRCESTKAATDVCLLFDDATLLKVNLYNDSGVGFDFTGAPSATLDITGMLTGSNIGGNIPKMGSGSPGNGVGGVRLHDIEFENSPAAYLQIGTTSVAGGTLCPTNIKVDRNGFDGTGAPSGGLNIDCANMLSWEDNYMALNTTFGTSIAGLFLKGNIWKFDGPITKAIRTASAVDCDGTAYTGFPDFPTLGQCKYGTTLSNASVGNDIIGNLALHGQYFTQTFHLPNTLGVSSFRWTPPIALTIQLIEAWQLTPAAGCSSQPTIYLVQGSSNSPPMTFGNGAAEATSGTISWPASAGNTIRSAATAGSGCGTQPQDVELVITGVTK